MPAALDGTAWRQELDDAARSIAGGLLFGVPLLFTMEVWWLGQSSTSAGALLALVFTLVPVALLIGVVGFRQRPEVDVREIVMDAVTAVGLAIVVVAIVLVVLQRITLSTPLHVAARMIVFETAPFAFGSAVAGAVFSRVADRSHGQDEQNGADANERPEPRDPVAATVADVAGTMMGATFVALSIAPTEEVPMLVTGIERPWLVVLVVAALLVTYLIVFSAGFGDQEARHTQEGLLQRPVTETGVAYLVALGASAVLLWFFGNLTVQDPATALAESVVLSFPAAVGGAAGRLVV